MERLYIVRVERSTKNLGGVRMTALQKIFQSYYDRRIEGEDPDPEKMRNVHKEIISSLNQLNIGNRDVDDVMVLVGMYGKCAEANGFEAGFRMAWELLKNMQEGAE